MGNELSRYNRVRYTLYGQTFNSLVINEPKGWNDDEKELLRSEKYLGIMANLSNNLEFYRKAFTALKDEYTVNGIKAVVRLEKEERNEQTDVWELSYSGYLDFSTYQQEKNFIKIKFNESPFFKNIESRIKDAFELERLDDLKGNVIPALAYKNFNFQGREILRNTRFTISDTDQSIDYNLNTVNDHSWAIPMDLEFRSDENCFAPAIAASATGNFANDTAECIANAPNPDNSGFRTNQMFYLTAPQTVTYTIHVSFDVEMRQSTNLSSSVFRRKFFRIAKCAEIGDNPIYPFRANYFEELGMVEIFSSALTYRQHIEKTFTITLAAGESLVLCMESHQMVGGGSMSCKFDNFVLEMNTVSASIITPTQALTYYQVFERLFLIITGKNNFQSTLLSTKWKDLLFTNGFKIRQFTEKNITTSLEEVYNSLNSIDDICMVVKNNTVRIEEKSFVFDKTTAIDLGQVSKLVRKIEEKHHFSIVELGSDFNGVYEEVNGLDEFNIRTAYSTCIDVVDNKLSAISKVRFDAYGPSLAQEKLFVNFPKEDTKYDKINFGFDSKLMPDGTYQVRHWADDFPQAPTGIFSPDTAFNLRLSPFNSFKRKSKTISTGLLKYPNDLIKYASTEGNSNLVTYVLDSDLNIVAQPERASVANNTLDQPYFIPETITFNKKISMMQFKTIVNNQYKLIKFVNEFGEEEYAFIYPSIKPNKEGKFTLIKANI